jgi:hypothetical protein
MRQCAGALMTTLRRRTLSALLSVPGGQEASRRRVLVTAAGLGALGFLLYLPSLSYDFVAYDDLRIVLEHPNLYDERSLGSSLQQIFLGYFPREEPLLIRDVSWALNSRLFGFRNPFGYHLGNVLLNACNTGLLFLFLLRATGRYGFALTVAALFLVLPVHVEPVCWVMGRKDVLCSFFVLLILLAEAHALDAAGARRRRSRLLGLGLYPLAILSKFSAVSLVLALAAYRLLGPGLRARQAPGAARATELLGLLPHLLVSAGIYLWYNRILTQFGVIGSPPGPAGEHLVALVHLIPLSIGLYVGGLVSGSERSIAYLFPHEAIPLLPGQRGAALVLGVGLVAFFVWAARRRRDLLFYGLAFLALMLPYFNILVVFFWRADRYLYLASFCVLAIVVQLAMDGIRAAEARGASRLARPLLLGGGLVWGLIAALITLAREPAFHDNHALWSHEVSLARPSVLAFQALSKSYVGRAGLEPDPARRALLLAEAERVALAGLRYYESIPWRPPRGSHLPSRLDYANLHVQLGRVAALRQAPLAAQIEHYLRSYQVTPTAANTLLLAQTLFDQAAATHDQEMARQSLRYYGEYITNARADLPRRAHLEEVLDVQYLRVFPGLVSAVETIKRMSWR